jgi:DAACS family dicarboxylate/amino acid:cation (Na+ or H+) symporter
MTLHTRILTGLLIGAALGGIANALWPNAQALAWSIRFIAHPLGQILLSLLFMLVVPLVFTSLSLGVAGLGGMRRLGRIGGRTLLFFFFNTVVAAALGLIIVLVLRPGEFLDRETRSTLMKAYANQAAAQTTGANAQRFNIDMLVAIVPRNPIAAATRDDMLGVITFTVLFGLALTQVPSEVSSPLVGGLQALD